MLHNLTIGASLSGKTTVNKLLCAGLRARGIKTAVLDPLRDGASWDVDFYTHDREKFLAYVRTAPERHALFIDESASALDKYDTRFDWLATTGRHLGHISHFICHRLIQLSPTIRAQSLKRWIFNVRKKDARELADEHNADELLTAAGLPKLRFFLVEPFKPVRTGTIRFTKRGPIVEFD